MTKENSKWAEEEKKRPLKLIIALVVSVIVIASVAFLYLSGRKAENQPPTASFTYSPLSPTAGETVQFTNQSSDPDGTISSWSWAFGDETTSNAQNPSHIYPNEGAYIVTLTVTDGSGASNKRSTVITVGEALPIENVFQNFESGNGTPSGIYFVDVWQSSPIFETSTVHSGTGALKITTGSGGGGTVAILAANPSGYIDLSSATSISIWVYDTQGNNTIQLRLRDLENDGGGGGDNYLLWSSMAAQQNQWTKITWDLSIYPSVPNLNRDRIASIELYEWNAGIYYFDDLMFS